jgi:hypothetical protein
MTRWFQAGWATVLLIVAVRAAEPLTPSQIAVLEAVAHNRYGKWTDLNSNQLSGLRIKAEKIGSEIRQKHLPGGLIASSRFADTNRAEVAAYEDLDLSAAYTGFYLAASAFRYAVYRESSALADIRAALDGVETLVRSTDRLGYLPRFVGLASDPAYREFYSKWGGADLSRPGYGLMAYPGSGSGAGLVWLGGPSPEVYAGVNLGLAAVQQIVREPAIRERTSNIVERIVVRLVADHWRLDDGRGHTNFTTPLLAAALLRTAASVDPKRFGAMYQSRLEELRNRRAMMGPPHPGLCLYCDYEDSVFDLANLTVLARLEPEFQARLFFTDWISQIWRQSNSHLNPWLAATYVSVFEHAPSDTAARATLQGMLQEFPYPRRAETRIAPTNEFFETIEANGQSWARYPLQLDERPVAAFQWSQTPVQIGNGKQVGLVNYPGLDFILPFWMARDANVIPDAESLLLVTPTDRNRFGTNSFRRRGMTNSVARTNGIPVSR